MGTYDRPDYDHMSGGPVTLTLHPWACKGPTEGILLGHGERGITLLIEGGGRWLYRYNEIKACVAGAGDGPQA